MNRNQYFQTLLEMFEKHIEATSYPDEYEIQQKILAFIEDTPLPEVDMIGDPYYQGDGNFAENH